MTVSIISNHIFIMHHIFYPKIWKFHYKIHLSAAFLLCENIGPLKNKTKWKLIIYLSRGNSRLKSEKVSLCQFLCCNLIIWGYPEIMTLNITVGLEKKLKECIDNQRVRLLTDGRAETLFLCRNANVAKAPEIK